MRSPSTNGSLPKLTLLTLLTLVVVKYSSMVFITDKIDLATIKDCDKNNNDDDANDDKRGFANDENSICLS